jgi:hypothetical protein
VQTAREDHLIKVHLDLGHIMQVIRGCRSNAGHFFPYGLRIEIAYCIFYMAGKDSILWVKRKVPVISFRLVTKFERKDS